MYRSFSILIMFVITGVVVGAAQGADPAYRSFRSNTNVEKESLGGERWPYELVESPFFIRIKTVEIDRQVSDLGSFPEDSPERFVLAYLTSLQSGEEEFLNEHSLYVNQESFTIRTDLMRKGSSVRDRLLRRYDIGDSIIMEFMSSSLNRVLSHQIVKVDGGFKWSLIDAANTISAVLRSAEPISGDVPEPEYEVEIPLGGELPTENKVFLSFDGSLMDQNIEAGAPMSTALKDLPKLRLYQELVRAVDGMDSDRIRAITTPDTYSIFLDEIQSNVRRGYEVYKRPFLETKNFRMEIANERVAYLFYQTEVMKKDCTYKVLVFRKSARGDWKITNFHGELFMEKLLVDPAVQRQVCRQWMEQ